MPTVSLRGITNTRTIENYFNNIFFDTMLPHFINVIITESPHCDTYNLSHSIY